MGWKRRKMEKQAGSDDCFFEQNLAKLRKKMMLELILVPFQYNFLVVF